MNTYRRITQSGNIQDSRIPTHPGLEIIASTLSLFRDPEIGFLENAEEILTKWKRIQSCLSFIQNSLLIPEEELFFPVRYIVDSLAQFYPGQSAKFPHGLEDLAVHVSRELIPCYKSRLTSALLRIPVDLRSDINGAFQLWNLDPGNRLIVVVQNRDDGDQSFRLGPLDYHSSPGKTTFCFSETFHHCTLE